MLLLFSKLLQLIYRTNICLAFLTDCGTNLRLIRTQSKNLAKQSLQDSPKNRMFTNRLYILQICHSGPMDKGIEDGKPRFQTSRKPPVRPPVSPNLLQKCKPEFGCG